MTIIAGSDFQNNSATGSGFRSHGGGAVFVDNGALRIGASRVNASRFTSNTAAGAGAVGGAVFAQGAQTTIDRTQFTSNSARLDGGAVAFLSVSNYTITNATFDNNSALEEDGGGLYINSADNAEVSVSGTTFTHNQAPHGRGGGVCAIGYSESGPSLALTIDESTFAGNTAARGGGIGLENGGVTIQRSTIANNVATGDAAHLLAVGPQIGGGGISADQSNSNVTNLTLSNTTVWGNKAGSLGGGGIAGAALQLTIANSTIAGNRAPASGGIALYRAGDLQAAAGQVTARGSIVAGNDASTPATANCSLNPSTIVAHLMNLEQATDCRFTHPGSLQNTDPLLDPAGLQNNGGPTQTVMLQPGSPAIDMLTHNTLLCPPADQRGQPRPDNPAEKACDMGSVETDY